MKSVRLQNARKLVGKTQAQVAAEASISEAAYQRYERGTVEPGVRIAIRIADALGIADLRDLFAEPIDGITTRSNIEVISTESLIEELIRRGSKVVQTGPYCEYQLKRRYSDRDRADIQCTAILLPESSVQRVSE